MNEAEMVTLAVAHLRRQGYLVACEVPCLGRSIDIAYITENDEVVSIEAKLRNWRHAIRQARDHSLAADFSFVLLPREANATKVRVLDAYGVGWMCFDSCTGTVRITHIPPSRLAPIRPVACDLRARILDMGLQDKQFLHPEEEQA